VLVRKQGLQFVFMDFRKSSYRLTHMDKTGKFSEIGLTTIK
jgi:hypothetical protein